MGFKGVKLHSDAKGMLMPAVSTDISAKGEDTFMSGPTLAQGFAVIS